MGVQINCGTFSVKVEVQLKANRKKQKLHLDLAPGWQQFVLLGSCRSLSSEHEKEPAPLALAGGTTAGSRQVNTFGSFHSSANNSSLSWQTFLISKQNVLDKFAFWRFIQLK